MKPCNCGTCVMCHRYENDPVFRQLCDGPQSVIVSLSVGRVTACSFLGKRIEAHPCLCWAQDLRKCDAGQGEVRHAEKCQSCNIYEADA